MIVIAALALWFVALSSHALLQAKLCRIMALPVLPHLPLHLGRLVLPLVALWLCLRLGTVPGVLTWFGTASVAGIMASLALTAVSLRQPGRRNLGDRTADAL